MESFSLLTHKKTIPARGFTLVEMLVVLAIIGVLLLITVLGQSDFNRTILLTDTAYTVALSVRESESFGLSSRLFKAVPNAGYGVYFSGSTPTSYVQFADISNTHSPVLAIPTGCPTGTAGYPDAKPGNCLYDGSNEQLQLYTLSQGYTISNICGLESGVGQICSSTYPNSSLHIVFVRPETDAVITGIVNGSEIPYTEGIIHILSPQGGEQCVVVTQLGQVSVAPVCP